MSLLKLLITAKKNVLYTGFPENNMLQFLVDILDNIYIQESWDIFHLKGELCLQYKNIFLQYFEAGIKANQNGILLDCKVFRYFRYICIQSIYKTKVASVLLSHLIKSLIFVVQKAAAPKNGVEFR